MAATRYNGVDLEQARDLMLATAARVQRVLRDPSPSCLVVGLGDNAINLELRVWINDPQNGVSSVKSDLYRDIWKEFREHHIGFPTPQETSSLQSIPDKKIRTEPEEG